MNKPACPACGAASLSRLSKMRHSHACKLLRLRRKTCPSCGTVLWIAFKDTLFEKLYALSPSVCLLLLAGSWILFRIISLPVIFIAAVLLSLCILLFDGLLVTYHAPLTPSSLVFRCDSSVWRSVRPCMLYYLRPAAGGEDAFFEMPHIAVFFVHIGTLDGGADYLSFYLVEKEDEAKLLLWENRKILLCSHSQKPVGSGSLSPLRPPQSGTLSQDAKESEPERSEAL